MDGKKREEERRGGERRVEEERGGGEESQRVDVCSVLVRPCDNNKTYLISSA